MTFSRLRSLEEGVVLPLHDVVDVPHRDALPVGQDDAAICVVLHLHRGVRDELLRLVDREKLLLVCAQC